MAVYAKLAPYYDILGWADFTYLLLPHLRNLFSSINSFPSRFLDIGCGTGVLAVVLSAMGIRVTGIDVAPEMIEVARSKTYRVEPAFAVADMCGFELGQTFPVVGCFYDTLNHLGSESELSRAFKCAYSHTEPGGCYVFDINTERGLMNWKPFYSSRRGSFYVTQRGSYDPETRSGAYRIEAFVRRADGGVQFITETVLERAYRRRFIREALAEAGFRRLVFMPFDRSESVAESERLFVICKR